MRTPMWKRWMIAALIAPPGVLIISWAFGYMMDNNING
jgi:uncharacterized BrkB/YihY/UPF0761 family membrane protein